MDCVEGHHVNRLTKDKSANADKKSPPTDKECDASLVSPVMPVKRSLHVSQPLPVRRRSKRNIHRIAFGSKNSLYVRRLEELFFREKRAQNEAIQIGNWTLTRVHSSPNIYIIEDFLTPTELDYLRSKICAGKFQRSYVDAVESGGNSIEDKEHRTSTFLSFGKQQDSKVASIEAKAATILGCWSSRTVEPLQLVRYLPGQFFGEHHDMGDLQQDGTVALPPKSLFSKRRLVTLFCYLNKVEKGGATGFRYCELKVPPKPGRAVMFSNVLPDGMPDSRTVHSGEPVLDGVKYGLNIWICEE